MPAMRRYHREFPPEPERNCKHKLKFAGKVYVVIADRDRRVLTIMGRKCSTSGAAVVPILLSTELAKRIAKHGRFILEDR